MIYFQIVYWNRHKTSIVFGKFLNTLSNMVEEISWLHFRILFLNSLVFFDCLA